MAIVVILILAGLWAAVLVPPLLRARHEHRGGDTIGDFNYRLGVLGKTNGARPRNPSRSLSGPARAATGVPSIGLGSGRMTRVQRRRRDVLLTLGAISFVTLVGALVVGGVAWFVWLLSIVALGAYTVMLVRIKQLAAERRAKVRYLPQRAPEQPPAFTLRRSASSHS